MDFEIADLLKVIGPSASIIFAAWIFMGFLQQRYDAAVSRYRDLVGEYRAGQGPDSREGHERHQILAYRRRCRAMNLACVSGLGSAIILIVALMLAEVAMALPSLGALKYPSAFFVLIGLLLVVVSAGIVLYDCRLAHQQIYDEVLDVPDLSPDQSSRGR